MRVGLIGRPEPGEALRIRPAIRAVRSEMVAVDVRGRLATRDLVALAPERDAGSDVDGRRQSQRDRLDRVSLQDELAAFEPTGKERGLVRDLVARGRSTVRSRGARIRRVEAGTERYVQRVPQVVIEFVESVRRAQIDRPPGRLRAQ